MRALVYLTHFAVWVAALFFIGANAYYATNFALHGSIGGTIHATINVCMGLLAAGVVTQKAEQP